VRDQSLYLDAERRYWEITGLSPTEHRIPLRHTGTTVRLQEVGDGPPVLFIHGASNSGVSWADLAVRLPDFRCLMLDRPGAGLSEPLRAPFENVASLAKFSDTLVVDVLDGLGLDSAHLVATSYGGYAALRAAAAFPERIDRIVILGWMMGAANPDMPFFMRLASVAPLGRMMAAMPINDSAVRSMFKRIGLRRALAEGRISDDLIACYTALLRHTDTMRNELEIGRWTMNWQGLNKDIVLKDDVLSKIQSDVYFLWGEEDPFGPADVARRFVERVPKGQLELVPAAGHAVWLDDPDHAADVTRRFLSEALMS
jgi:pimeloyl-ACP methyl ester carboxylesterase